MTTDEAYLAIKNNDIDGLRSYLEVPQSPMNPDQLLLMKSLMGYAIEHEKDEVVEFLICEAGVPRVIWNDWFRIWANLIKPNYKIKNLLNECSDDDTV